jgi:predicted site-specific integrase-resolvase
MDLTDTLSSGEACAILDVDRSTLIRWVYKGIVKDAHKMPGDTGAYLFSRAEIARLARERLAAREGAA